jgi:predicted exporter
MLWQPLVSQSPRCCPCPSFHNQIADETTDTEVCNELHGVVFHLAATTAAVRSFATMLCGSLKVRESLRRLGSFTRISIAVKNRRSRWELFQLRQPQAARPVPVGEPRTRL